MKYQNTQCQTLAWNEKQIPESFYIKEDLSLHTKPKTPNERLSSVGKILNKVFVVISCEFVELHVLLCSFP